jgi:hypothetical protein
MVTILAVISTPSSTASKKHSEAVIKKKFAEWLRNTKKCTFAILGIALLRGDRYPAEDARLLQLYGQYAMRNLECCYFFYDEVKAAQLSMKYAMPVSAKTDGRTAITDFLMEQATGATTIASDEVKTEHTCTVALTMLTAFHFYVSVNGFVTGEKPNGGDSSGDGSVETRTPPSARTPQATENEAVENDVGNDEFIDDDDDVHSNDGGASTDNDRMTESEDEYVESIEANDDQSIFSDEDLDGTDGNKDFQTLS